VKGGNGAAVAVMMGGSDTKMMWLELERSRGGRKFEPHG
jgi:hypothetical protein